MIHLKRFDFNYDTMLRAKLSNFFDFPMELDMEPYTTEGVARREALSVLEAKKKEALSRAEGTGAEKISDEGNKQALLSLFLPKSRFNLLFFSIEWINEFNIEIPGPIHPKSYYDYELVGVLVHSGIYYLFIFCLILPKY